MIFAPTGLIRFAAPSVLLLITVFGSLGGCSSDPHVKVNDAAATGRSGAEAGDDDVCSAESLSCAQDERCEVTAAGPRCVSVMVEADDAMSSELDAPPAVCESDADCAPEAFCSDSGSCECGEGYRSAGTRCEDVDECATDNGGCAAVALCENLPGGRECTCPSGFVGDGEECLDIDECASADHGCSEDATCMNSVGSYECVCPEGYSGDGKRCDDVDECAGDNDCDENAVCSNQPGGYECKCRSGFVGDGEECTDIDECEDGSDCDPMAECTNTDGSFLCGDCTEGFTGGGESGCVDIDECETNFGDCAANERCENTVGGRECIRCPDGYTRGEEGTCIDVNECESGTNVCGAFGSCTNTEGSYECTCLAGYQDNDGDKVCQADCSTALGGEQFIGTCPGCGENGPAWETAAQSAFVLCSASCAGDCTRSAAAYDQCTFDSTLGDYHCTSYCGQEPKLRCDDDVACDDASGTALCACEDGYQDNDGDGHCEPSCSLVTSVAAFRGQCQDCGDNGESLAAARSEAETACMTSGCSEGCLATTRCRFDDALDGHVCSAHCGPLVKLVCEEGLACADSDGSAGCQPL